MTTLVTSRSARHPRSRVRPAFYIPVVLFCTSIVGGLVVLATELPGVPPTLFG
jgi:hypothetical protein